MRRRRSALKTPRIRRKKRNKIIFRVVGVLILIGLFIFGIYKLLRIPTFLITTVEASGNSATASSDIQTIADQNLSGSYFFGLIPASNRFFYSKIKIQQEILTAFPRLDSAVLSVSGNTLIVTVDERAPAYLWCIGLPTDTTDKSCYFADSNGYIFSQAPVFSGNSYLSLYGNINATSSPIGQSYVDLATFKNLTQFKNDLTPMGLSSYALVAEENGVYDLYLTKGGRIVFTSDEEISTLESDIETLKAGDDVFDHSGSSTLDYVDLRFGNKIYYK